MKKHLLFLAALVLVGCTRTPSVPLEEEYGPYTICQVEPGLWHLRDCNASFPPAQSLDSAGQPRYNNCSDMYLLVGNREALLVDLSNRITWSDSAESSLRHLVSERVGDLPLTITFTHNHGDHVGMLAAYLSDPTVRFLLPRHDFQDRLDMFADAASIDLYDEGYVFDLGGQTIRTVEVPGHTCGSMVFLWMNHHILLTGDAVGSGSGVWIFDAEGLALYREAVPHLLAFVRDPANAVDTTRLRLLGGHYHQNPNPSCLGMTYLTDMQEALNDAFAGTAETRPFELNWRGMDTYYIHGSASIVTSSEALNANR